MSVLTSFSLDLTQNSPLEYIFAKQGDASSRSLEITLTNNGVAYTIPANVTPRIRMTKKDGTQIYNDGTVASNKITVEMTDQMLAVPGIAVADIQLIGADGLVLSSQLFYLNIEEYASSEGGAVSTDEYTALTNALVRLEQTEAITAAAEAATAEAEAAAGEVTEAITDVNAAKQAANTAASSANTAAGAANTAKQNADTATAAANTAAAAANTAKQNADTATSAANTAAAAANTAASSSILKSIATAADQVLISTAAGAWAVKTLAQFKIWLALTAADISDFSATVRSTVLTGLSTASSAAVAATDSVLTAIGKLQAQITANLTTLTNHTGNTSNPHSVTAAQAGAVPTGGGTLTGNAKISKTFPQLELFDTAANRSSYFVKSFDGNLFIRNVASDNSYREILLSDKNGNSDDAAALQYSLNGTGYKIHSQYNLPIESGTWTPTLRGSTTAGANTYSAQNGYYVKIGSLIFVYGRVTLSAKDAAMSGYILISGLPISIKADFNGFTTCNISYFGSFTGLTGYGLSGNFQPSNSTIELFSLGQNASIGVTAANINNTTDVIFSGIYRI